VVLPDLVSGRKAAHTILAVHKVPLALLDGVQCIRRAARRLVALRDRVPRWEHGPVFPHAPASVARVPVAPAAWFRLQAKRRVHRDRVALRAVVAATAVTKRVKKAR
jgi:hypothetical protein